MRRDIGERSARDLVVVGLEVDRREVGVRRAAEHPEPADAETGTDLDDRLGVDGSAEQGELGLAMQIF